MITKLSLLISLAVALSGCGSFSGLSVDEESISTSLTGRSSKGPISGADVIAIALLPDGSEGESLGSTVTGNDGRFRIDLKTYSGPLLIAVSGGIYRDEATGIIVHNPLTLHAALSQAFGKVSVMVTPLTELAYRKAGLLTADNIREANSLVSTLTGIDVISCEPIDPSDPYEAAEARQEQKDYSLLLAALSQVLMNQGTAPFPAVMSEATMDVRAASMRVTEAPLSPVGDISHILDDLANDIADGDLNLMDSMLITGLADFLGSEQNNTGILNLDDTGLDEAITSRGMSYSGVWYETGSESGEFMISLEQTDGVFEGTYFSTTHGVERENRTFSIEGTHGDGSYRGTDSMGREFIFALLTHPLDGSGTMLAGSYLDEGRKVNGSLRSTNNNKYNSAVGFVILDGDEDSKGAEVSLKGDLFHSAVANEHGFYILSGIPDGIHHFQATMDGFTTSESGPWSFSGSATHHPNVNFTLDKAPMGPPEAVTTPASGITTGEASLRGSVFPNNLATETWFEWGESSTSLTYETARQAAVSGEGEIPVTVDVTGLDPGTTYYFRLVAENSAGRGSGAIMHFTTGKPAAPPVTTTRPATTVSTGSAKLHGSVNPNELPTLSCFEWGASSSSLSHRTPPEDAGSGSSSLAREFTLTGLDPGTTYYFRLVAENSAGKESGEVLNFTTPELAVPPGAATLPATSVGIHSANLHGTVNPNGFAAEARFEWGTSSSSLTMSTPKQSMGSGNSSREFQYGLSGLEPETTYYYRAAAENSGGTMKGAILSFKTKRLPVPPGAVTMPASSVTSGSAKLNGSVDPNGYSTEFWFELGTSSSSLGNRTAKFSAGSGTSALSVSHTIGSLTPGTRYYFRVVAANSGGTMKGDTLSFTTTIPALPPGVSTDYATEVTTNSAILNGKVDPNGYSTEFWFELGTSSSSLGNRTAKFSAGSGTSALSVSHTIGSLTPGTRYYFRVVAANSGGTMKGDTRSFTTGRPEVTLRWKAPTTNVDGSPVSDLSGYRIYYGTSSKSYTYSVDVGNVTEYTLKSLPGGRVYFAVTCYDLTGNESDFSEEMSKYLE